MIPIICHNVDSQYMGGLEQSRAASRFLACTKTVIFLTLAACPKDESKLT